MRILTIDIGFESFKYSKVLGILLLTDKKGTPWLIFSIMKFTALNILKIQHQILFDIYFNI